MAKQQVNLEIKDGKIHLPVAKGEDWILDNEQTYSPLQLMVQAVAACGASVFKNMVKNSNVEASLIAVDIEYTRDETTDVRPINSLNLIYKVDAKAEKAQRMSKTIASRIGQYCPVMQSLDQTIAIEESVEFV